MAVVHVKSQSLQDIEALRTKKLNPIRSRGRVREDFEVIETNADDSIGSTFRFMRLPSRARVSALLGYSDGAGSAGVAEVGLYHVNGGAAVDTDLFEDGWTVATAGRRVDLVTEPDIGDLPKRLWELLGLSEDPGVDYDVALTLTTAIAGAATTIGVQAQYILDE